MKFEHPTVVNRSKRLCCYKLAFPLTKPTDNGIEQREDVQTLNISRESAYPSGDIFDKSKLLGRSSFLIDYPGRGKRFLRKK
jgi:hypothetical protein